MRAEKGKGCYNNVFNSFSMNKCTFSLSQGNIIWPNRSVIHFFLLPLLRWTLKFWRLNTPEQCFLNNIRILLHTWNYRTACTKPAKDHYEWGRSHKVLSLTETLLATVSCWKRESQLSLGMLILRDWTCSSRWLYSG